MSQAIFFWFMSRAIGGESGQKVASPVTSSRSAHYAISMTEKAPKRTRRKNSEPAATTTEPAAPKQIVWISASDLKRVLEIMSVADNMTIQQVIDRMNAKITAKELMIFPQFSKVAVKS
jgi:hypothetical protein